MISPYKGKFRVSQIYKGQTHKGLDLVGVDSKKIYSTVNGTVEAAGHDSHPTGGMGLYIRIKEDGTSYRFYFAHLSKTNVKVGQRVKEGTEIGAEGSTGHSTGSHLHYEVRREPNNKTFLDVSKISGIPNKMGTHENKEAKAVEVKETIVSVGDYEVRAKLINNVTYVSLREFVDAIKTELAVTWSAKEGAGVKL